MKKWFTIMVIMVLLSFNATATIPTTTPETPTERRVALVIGNAAYDKFPLSNPLNDAKAIAQRLREYQFDVTELHDLKTHQASEVIQNLSHKIDANTTFVFFYAGHGVQIQGENYLPNVDVSLTHSQALKASSIKVNDLLQILQTAKPRAAILILDACRDNPFGNELNQMETAKGLARSVAPAGTVIFYATRPGSTASDGEGTNGLFTEQLLREIRDPHRPIELVFRRVSNAVYNVSKGKQEPWIEGVVREEIILASQKNSQIAAVSNIINTPSLPPVPTFISKDLALAQLRQFDLTKDSIPTQYWCTEQNCETYASAFQRLRQSKQLPQMPRHFRKVRLCEYDLDTQQCKVEQLRHGTGVSPVALFAKLAGSSVNTQSLLLSDVKNSNGGGLSFEYDPQVIIERTRLGNSNPIRCKTGSARLEWLPDQVEFELAQNICMQSTPPIPWQYKLQFNVLLWDHKTMKGLVRWKQRGYSIGMVMASEGIAQLSFE
jgi:hypothetical protein